MYLLSTDCMLGYGLNRIFEFAKEAKFDGIELAMNIRLFDTQNADYINRLKKEYKLPVEVLRTFPNSTVKQTLMALELAKDVGAKMVVLEPPKLFDFKYKEWMKKQVPSLRKKYKLMIALKNGPSEYLWGVLPKRALSSIPDLQNFKEVSLDISNLYDKKIDLMRAYEIMKPYMVHVHMSNVLKGSDHNLPNDGIMPVESFLTKLKKDKYSHSVSLLVKPRALEAGNDKAMMKNLDKVKKFYDRYVK